MTYHVDVQQVCENENPVSNQVLSQWVISALSHKKDAGELTLRLVDPEEIQQLNQTYRQQDKPTNVLAFPSNIPQDIVLDLPFLGDVIICPRVLKTESEALNKPLIAHWAHIVIHGVLHLLGYDHIKDEDARIMQSIETKLLARHGFEDPYYDEVNTSE